MVLGIGTGKPASGSPKRSLNHVDLLQNFPYLGIPMKHFSGVRRLHHSPIHVYYRIDESRKMIEVLYFWYAARNNVRNSEALRFLLLIQEQRVERSKRQSRAAARAARRGGVTSPRTHTGGSSASPPRTAASSASSSLLVLVPVDALSLYSRATTSARCTVLPWRRRRRSLGAAHRYQLSLPSRITQLRNAAPSSSIVAPACATVWRTRSHGSVQPASVDIDVPEIDLVDAAFGCIIRGGVDVHRVMYEQQADDYGPGTCRVGAGHRRRRRNCSGLARQERCRRLRSGSSSRSTSSRRRSPGRRAGEDPLVEHFGGDVAGRYTGPWRRSAVSLPCGFVQVIFRAGLQLAAAAGQDELLAFVASVLRGRSVHEGAGLQLDAARRSTFVTNDRIVLPCGLIEQHEDLLLGVDMILSERAAVEAAQPLGVPVMSAAVCIMLYFAAHPGSPTLSVETYQAAIRNSSTRCTSRASRPRAGDPAATRLLSGATGTRTLRPSGTTGGASRTWEVVQLDRALT